MNRREVLEMLAAVPLLAAIPSCARPSEHPMTPSTPRMPVIFLAHGAPPLLDDPVWVQQLADWAKALPRPTAVLMVSAHWEARPTTLGATKTVPLYYDFYGFPQRYYEVKYPAPGAPALAERVRDLLGTSGFTTTDDATRGLDHGAYVPLVAMYPAADVPVLQISMPGLDPKALWDMGRALAPLRDEGVLIVGSGFLTHNMRYAFVRGGTPQWASEFDAWVGDALAHLDADALVDFERRAPAARMALPTTEHYVPALVAAGAATSSDPVTFPITGWWMDGAFTKRSVQFG
jgi:4,5-DOPA dioxygenase extradiol